jgi:hypothetical protein
MGMSICCGVATEFLARGREVRVFEPRNSWGAQSLVAEHGKTPPRHFHAAYPALKATRYDLRTNTCARSVNQLLALAAKLLNSQPTPATV